MLCTKMAAIQLILLALLCAFCWAKSFNVIWNVPSSHCQQFGLKFDSLLRQYGITVNEGDDFRGEKMTIFYDSQLGFYPKILNNGTYINGGIPQLGDLELHLKKLSEDINAIVPNKKAEGLRVIDWEAWRPVWEFNWEPLKIYQKKSKALVREQHPNWTEKSIEKMAEKKWEESAKTWMLSTLEVAKQMQPNSIWCFYLFPDCYNYKGNSPQEFQCSDGVKKGNDKLAWLWNASTAICPSIYVYESQLQRFNSKQRAWFTNGRLLEAIRVARANAFIYPYVSYSLKPGKMVPKEDFWRIVAQVGSLGMDGVVIWGSFASVASQNYCHDLLKYLVNVLGPASEKVMWNYKRCSKEVCDGRGACTWPDDKSVMAWRHFIEKEDNNFYAGDITCRCVKGYTGRFCQKMSPLI